MSKSEKEIEEKPKAKKEERKIVKVTKAGVTVVRTIEELDFYLSTGWKEVK